MRVTHVSTVDVLGGACRGAWRLHRGLRAAGVDSCMLVQDKLGDDPHVHGPSGNVAKAIGKVRPYIEPWLTTMTGSRPTAPFSPQWLPGPFLSRLSELKSDLVHLHWVCGGFVRIEHLRRIGAPLVWTFRDSWPLTGGCHCRGGCTRYEQSCGSCPVLGAGRENDLSRGVWRRKAKSWRDLKITVVTPSTWMAESARRSSLFGQARIEVIPNGVDTSLYRPMDRVAARERVGLPPDRRIVMFCAMNATSDRNKGFEVLRNALRMLRAQRDDVDAIVVGAGEPGNPPDFGLRVRYMGRCHDDFALALLYSAADVVVVPSEEENFPSTILESMASGTPCVAFKVGGIPDLIRHGVNGYLATPRDPDELCRGIVSMLNDPQQWTSLSGECRRRAVAEYDMAVVAKRYVALYEGLLKPCRG